MSRHARGKGYRHSAERKRERRKGQLNAAHSCNKRRVGKGEKRRKDVRGKRKRRPGKKVLLAVSLALCPAFSSVKDEEEKGQ